MAGTWPFRRPTGTLRTMRISTSLRGGVFLAIGLALAANANADAVTILVRHAEKVDASADPELTAAGHARAQSLARLLAKSDIDAVYSTDTIRTRDTARPVAERLGLEITIYDGRRLEDLAAELKAKGRRALVVGHSNTTPALVTLLGGDAGPPIPDEEYDRLYFVVNGNTATTLRLVQPEP